MSGCYDDHQLGAVLVQCATCQRFHYHVVPNLLCHGCRNAQPIARSERPTGWIRDAVNGWQIVED